MQREVQNDLISSALAFERAVWPEIREKLGGGRIVRVEGVDSPLARLIDGIAGIDYWQVCDAPLRMRGIGARVQFPERAGDRFPYNSFTIRFRRDSMVMTELAKRRLAIIRSNSGWLYPAITIQAYVSSRQHPSLVSAAAIATTTLYRFVDQGIPGLDYTIDRTSNATFIVVYWDDLQ